MNTHTTHTTHHTTDTTLIEMRIVNAKPECKWHLLHQAENLKRLYEKSGVKVMALWMTQAGATHELITMVQHASFASRCQYKEFRMTDPEWVKFDITIAKFFTEVEDYLCKTSINMPTMKKTFTPNGKYLIQMIRTKGFLPFDSKKLFEASCEMERCEGENACPAMTILVPIMTTKQCLIVIREFPEDTKADAALNAYRDAHLDSKNWGLMHDASMHYTRERNVLVRGIPMDRVETNAALE
jgi:hypothetical protein